MDVIAKCMTPSLKKNMLFLRDRNLRLEKFRNFS